jgi:hypothetical protein
MTKRARLDVLLSARAPKIRKISDIADFHALRLASNSF